MTFTPGEALSYGGWPEAEKTPNLLEELETWRKSSWEGEGKPAVWASLSHDSLAEGEP